MTMKIFTQGSGVIIDGWRASPAVAARIEALGKLNDRRMKCIESGDVEGLRILASEYAAKNMLRTANTMYKEIAIMESSHAANL